MRTIEVTDDQYAFIQRLREEISADVVGKYGFVRERDAIQFLIDNLDEDVDVDADVDFSATDDVAASVGAAIDGEPAPTDLDELSYDETDDSPAEADSSPTDGSPDGQEVSAEDSPDGEEGSDEESSSDDGAEGSGAADDDDMLDEMMSLLETHDDKWEESSSSDYRYSVTLPDGSVEDVQTKDDVRALLFKNYR